MTHSPKDLERFRNPKSKLQTPRKTFKKSSKNKLFLKGPIPCVWLQIASSLPGRALHVGLTIWFLSGLTKKKQVKVTRRALNNFSTPPDAYRRGLKRLEDARLVSVIRKKGCAALVTLLDPPGDYFDK